MPEALHLGEPFYIVADAERTTAPLRVLKHGDSFAVFDPYGDVLPSEASEQGLYHDGTRFLSRLELLFSGRRALLLSSTVSDDNAVFTADLTNPDIRRDNAVAIARGELHFSRSRVLLDGTWSERLRLANYSLHAIEAPITVRFDADFADVFEVRGMRRRRRGQRLPDLCDDECLLRYRGLDDVERRTRIRWDPHPVAVEAGAATFKVRLEPHATAEIRVHIACELEPLARDAQPFEQALSLARRGRTARAGGCRVISSNESFNRWIRRSTADLEMMLTETPHGLYPYAGIPWFSTPFGRDGLITALSLLWADPAIARGVLNFLADTQARSSDDARDAQPGKILHEMRRGEMAALREVPFDRYYGSVDATPLFVVLAHAYYERTADDELVDRLWPHIVAALDWLTHHGDCDGDGLIEYARRSESGLLQQGWKDSWDSIFHQDGALADPPIALCEVQGYAYNAWHGAARLASVRGDAEAAGRWAAAAERLRARFEESFWCEDLGTYALALDGAKRPCRVRTSNPGHCLFSGIVARDRARRVADTLLAEASFAGWGIRTVGAGESRYNPMSYHNGSIWPHDNALIAAGFARYGMSGAASAVLSAIFELSQAVDLHRLPELICGFARRGGEFPILYPVACAPQAWAAAAAYLLLESSLGLRIDAVHRRISMVRGTLPDSIAWLRIENLSCGDARVDLLLERHPHDLGVTVLRREGELDLTIVK